MDLSAGQAIVEILKAENVRYVFGMPGGHTIGIYDALYDCPEIQHVLVRHEHAAAAMAAGYAQLTGEPGICCTTAGPGATNLITAITEAYVGALPVVILAGRGPTRNAHRGASQEIDQVQMFRPITKWAVRVDRADLLPELLRHAFVVARSGKPGPVLIDLPQDIGVQRLEFEGYVPAGKPRAVRADLASIEDASRLLAAAKRPLIVAGGGAVAAGAADELRKLAERLAIPVMTTLSGRSILPDDHPLAAGGIGHHRTMIGKKLLPEADVVLGIGCRFEQQETNWKPAYLPARESKYIQIDIDGAEMGRSVVPDVPIVGDAKLVLADINESLERNGAPAHYRDFQTHERAVELASMVRRLEAEIDDWAGSLRSPIHPIRVLSAAQEVFPRDATVIIDVGVLAQGMAGAFPYFKVYEPRSLITPSSFYGMGYSASAAPAAPLARPGHPALCFVGDGSFHMALHALPVARELKSPLTWCVLDDQALGSIRDIQQQAYNGRYIGTEFETATDFAKIAEACGCHGERVEKAEDVPAAFERALAANEQGIPAVLDFIVAKERLVGSMEFFAR